MTSVIYTIIIQLLVIILASLAVNFVKKLFYQRLKNMYNFYDLWPIFMMYYGCVNLTIDIFPYFMIGWMGIGIIVVLVQLIHNHEVIYKKFFFIFWRISIIYGIFTYICSLIWLILG